MRLAVRAIVLASSLVGIAACASDPPPPQISLARLASAGCLAYDGQPIDRVCLPKAGGENVPLVLELEERCGSCATTVERCSVTVDGRDVTLSLDGRSCPAPSGSCADVCTKRRVACRLPALPAGRYAVRYADGTGRVDVLEIAAGGATQCALDT